jgi:hypothetical protein
MTAYVYYSYEPWGRGYIGARGRRPDGDDYLGSFSDPTFTPSEKIVLAVFDTMEEALDAECALHEFYDVGRNPHFANRARQTSAGFTTAGVEVSEETRLKISKGSKGKTRSAETCKKISENNYSKTEKAKESKRGDKNPARREEVRAKLRGNKSRTGMTNSEEMNGKISGWMSKSMWINNGERSRRIPATEEIPEGWERGRTMKPRRKKST